MVVVDAVVGIVLVVVTAVVIVVVSAVVVAVLCVDAGNPPHALRRKNKIVFSKKSPVRII